MGGPGQLICQGWGLTIFFVLEVEGSEKNAVHPLKGFFLEQPSVKWTLQCDAIIRPMCRLPIK